MKSLVAYFSFTGKTRLAAETIARVLQSEKAEIEETKNRSMLGALLQGGYQAIRRKGSVIFPVRLDWSKYDTIAICTPVWASRPTPAVNSFIESVKLEGKNVILLITSSSEKTDKARDMLTSDVEAKGGKVIATLILRTSGMKEDEIIRRSEEFAAGLLKNDAS